MRQSQTDQEPGHPLCVWIEQNFILMILASEPDVVVCTYNHSTWRVEAGESGVQSRLQLSTKVEASLGCVRPCVVASLGCQLDWTWN